MARKKNKTKKYDLRATIVFVVALVVIAVGFYLLRPVVSDLMKKDTASNDSANSVTSVTEIIADAKNDAELKMHVISVGQADSIFIEFPTGHCMLVDAAEKSSVGNVVTYITGLGYDTLDYVLLTHQDSDHAGGMAKVFDEFTVKHVFRPSVYSKYKNYDLPETFNIGISGSPSKTSTTETYYNFLKSVYYEEGCTWEAFNKDSDFGLIAYDESDDRSYECFVDFLTPTADTQNIAYRAENDFSPIMIISYCGFKIMLTGDAEELVEKELLDYYADIYPDYSYFDVDVLKVGHHGSKTSSSRSFVETVKPEYSFISCGLAPEKQKYCPWQVTLDTLKDNDSLIYRTDLQGNIVLTVDKDGKYNIATEKTCNDYSLILSGYSNAEPEA
ncbi:MAG: MBL fold metallo-hydrolase [Clostridia bacterium]|nr:MBL fold metallo-hydrolase [Clostridia bacterium]